MQTYDVYTDLLSFALKLINYLKTYYLINKSAKARINNRFLSLKSEKMDES